jgi:hypothetical protein
VLVQDNLNTHKPASLYEAFPAVEARRLVERFEWHYTPKHGSWLDMCRFSDAGNHDANHALRRPASEKRQGTKSRWGERRRCRNYGDFAAGSGVDVVERGGNVRNFAPRHVRELNCERVTDRLCNAILRF